jgi:hypothetical protein
MKTFAQHVDKPHGRASTLGSQSPPGRYGGVATRNDLRSPTSGARGRPVIASKRAQPNGTGNRLHRGAASQPRVRSSGNGLGLYNLYARFGKW